MYLLGFGMTSKNFSLVGVRTTFGGWHMIWTVSHRTAPLLLTHLCVVILI